MYRTPVLHRKQRGITLMELMIVVAIIAIISAIAYPSYTQYVINTKRATAVSELLQVADRQQQFFMDNKTYAGNLTNLGFAANPHVVADNGNSVAAADANAIYSLALSNVTATTYTITATPLHGQLSGDTECGSLALTQAGARSASGAGTDCW